MSGSSFCEACHFYGALDFCIFKIRPKTEEKNCQAYKRYETSIKLHTIWERREHGTIGAYTRIYVLRLQKALNLGCNHVTENKVYTHACVERLQLYLH